MPIVIAENFKQDTPETIVLRYPGSKRTTPTGVSDANDKFPVNRGSVLEFLQVPFNDDNSRFEVRLELSGEGSSQSPGIFYVFGIPITSQNASVYVFDVDLGRTLPDPSVLNIVVDRVGPSKYYFLVVLNDEVVLSPTRVTQTWTPTSWIGTAGYAAGLGNRYTGIPSFLDSIVVAVDTEPGTYLGPVDFTKRELEVVSSGTWTYTDTGYVEDTDKQDPTVGTPRIQTLDYSTISFEVTDELEADLTNLYVNRAAEMPERSLSINGDLHEASGDLQVVPRRLLADSTVNLSVEHTPILWDPAVKIANPDVLPTGNGQGVAFSPDNSYLAVAHSGSPFLTIYKRDGDTFTKLANPDVLPAGSGTGVAFSPDGLYLAVGHGSSPFINIYKRNGDTFTKLANPDILPPNTGQGVAFSPDNSYLAVAHGSSPYLTIYKRDGDTFTKLANPDVLPPGTCYGAAFSPDGLYLAVAHIGSPFITIYKRNGDTFTKLANPSVLPSSNGYSVAFSSDGLYLAVGHNISPNLTVYKRNGDTFTKLDNPDVLPPSVGYGVAFSPDGLYLAIAHASSPFITIYKRNGDLFTKLANPDVLPTSTGYGAAFSIDNSYLAVAHVNSPNLTVYKPEP